MVGSIRRESFMSIDSKRLRMSSLKRPEPIVPIKPAQVRCNTCFHYYRYVVIALGGLLAGWMFLFRFAFNVVMISMVNKTAIYLKEHPNNTVDDFFPPDYVEDGEFVWTNEVQQIIMTGYMVSYAIPQYATTRLSIKYGLGRSLPVSLGLCALSSLLTPYFAYWGWEWVLALRLINGVGASAMLPSMLSLIEIWMPEQDMGLGFAMFQFSSTIIQVFVPLVCGFLASFHWQWAFYVPGALGLAICCVWLLLVTDEPASSRLISQQEVDWIYGSKEQADSSDERKEQAEQRDALPWYFVFKIRVFYPLTLALILLDSTCSGFYFIMPSYLHRILETSVADIGFISFVVQIATVFCTLWPDPLARFLQSTFSTSLTGARRIMSTTCSFMVCLSFFYLAKYNDNLISVITINRFFHVSNDLIMVSTILSMFSAQKLTGLVFSVINAFGNLSVLFICWAIGRYLDYAGESLECWTWILASLGVLNFIYLINYFINCPSSPIHVDIPPLKKKNIMDEEKFKPKA